MSHFATLCGELDAKALDDIEVLIVALSRTQASQLEAKEGLELRLWYPTTTRATSSTRSATSGRNGSSA